MKCGGIVRGWQGRRATLAACCGMLVVIAAYAGLLRRSSWQGDEYIVFAFQRDGGWRFLIHWYLTWSPRLVSDILFAAYGIVVTVSHRPLAGTCMAVLWSGLFFACVGPAMATARQRQTRLLLGLAIFTLFLDGHGVADVFYWPAGGLSYIPTLAGIAWLFWCVADSARVPQWRPAAALVVVAGSSEVGIFLALSICTLVIAWSRQRIVSLWWMAPGLVLGLVDLVLVLNGRVGNVEIASAGPLLHHAGASLASAVPIFARELIVPNNEISAPINWAWSLVARVLVIFAARWSLEPADPKQRRLLLLFAAGLLLGSFASLASSLYEFGTLCCERHDTMSACSITLALIAFGVWSAGRWPLISPPRNLAASAWMAAVVLLFGSSLPGLIEDWRTAPQAVSARAQTWASGRASAANMILIRGPVGRIVGSSEFSRGEYRRIDKALPWYDFAVLSFFEKQTMIVK